MRTSIITRSGTRRLAGIAGAGVLALTLAACGGGSSNGGDSGNSGQGQVGGEATQAAPETGYKQLDKAALENIITSVTYDGQSFKAIPVGEPQKDALANLENAEIEPAQCKDYLLQATGQVATDNPTVAGVDDSNQGRYVASVTSFPDEAAAQAQMAIAGDLGDKCKEMKINISGQEVTMGMEVKDLKVDGADEAYDQVTHVAGMADMETHTVFARVGNGVVSAGDQKEPVADAATEIAAELAKAYEEAAAN